MPIVSHIYHTLTSIPYWVYTPDEIDSSPLNSKIMGCKQLTIFQKPNNYGALLRLFKRLIELERQENPDDHLSFDEIKLANKAYRKARKRALSGGRSVPHALIYFSQRSRERAKEVMYRH